MQPALTRGRDSAALPASTARNPNVVRELLASSIPFNRHLKRTSGRKIITRLFLFAIMLTLCAGAVFARMNVAAEDSLPNVRENNLLHTLGAFRDGLYLGRLAAGRGEDPHISLGRWSSPANRELFAAGYRQGYDEAATLQALAVNRQR